VVIAILVSTGPAWRHARALALLTGFSAPKATGTLAEFGRHALTESTFEFRGESGPVPARLCSPAGVKHPPGIVVEHIADRHHMRENQPAFGRRLIDRHHHHGEARASAPCVAMSARALGPSERTSKLHVCIWARPPL
jgi:hypothetical protein